MLEGQIFLLPFFIYTQTAYTWNIQTDQDKLTNVDEILKYN